MDVTALTLSAHAPTQVDGSGVINDGVAGAADVWVSPNVLGSTRQQQSGVHFLSTSSALIIARVKPCKIEPTWSVTLNTPTRTNQEADIFSLYCDKHLATYQRQVQDFNLFIQEASRLESDSNEQEWRLSFSTKWFARKISRATWVEASLTDIHGKKTSSADREFAIKIFVCQGQENVHFLSHVRQVKNYFFSGRI